jgi:hypothetical protein
VNRTSCGIVGAQAGRTIWLYEAWWKAPSLKCAKGIRPEKRHNARMLDALADAFMQTQEGTLFHEVSANHVGFHSSVNHFSLDCPFGK